MADDFKTIKGKEYKNAVVMRVEADGIVLRTKGGISKIYFVELPEDVQARFGHDPAKIKAEAAAARAAQQKRLEEQKAADRQRIEEQRAAEREHAERVRKAESDLKRSLDQFQIAEQRAVEAYQNAPKGTLSGQVFVSSEKAENFKLGAVQVSLFARDAIDVLLAGVKVYADIKTQELSPSDHDSYYSGSFYFGYLRSPISTVETDAEGKFIVNVPKEGSFVIAAKAQRYVGKRYVGQTGMDITEHYYWIQPVSLEGQQQRIQNLSNNNLTKTAGTSSLIHTED